MRIETLRPSLIQEWMQSQPEIDYKRESVASIFICYRLHNAGWSDLDIVDIADQAGGVKKL